MKSTRRDRILVALRHKMIIISGYKRIYGATNRIVKQVGLFGCFLQKKQGERRGRNTVISLLVITVISLACNLHNYLKISY